MPQGRGPFALSGLAVVLAVILPAVAKAADPIGDDVSPWTCETCFPIESASDSCAGLPPEFKARISVRTVRSRAPTAQEREKTGPYAKIEHVDYSARVLSANNTAMAGKTIRFSFVQVFDKDSLFRSNKLVEKRTYSVLGLESPSSGQYKVLLTCPG